MEQKPRVVNTIDPIPVIMLNKLMYVHCYAVLEENNICRLNKVINNCYYSYKVY